MSEKNEDQQRREAAIESMLGEELKLKTEAAVGDTVRVEFVGKLEDGTEFDATNEGAPLDFTIGIGEVIQGFEKGVLGMKPGETKTVKVPCEEAYGPVQNQLIGTLAIKDLPEDTPLSLGGKLEVTQEGEEPIVVTITDLTETHVTLDANHPLAGKELTFELKLLVVV